MWTYGAEVEPLPPHPPHPSLRPTAEFSPMEERCRLEKIYHRSPQLRHSNPLSPFQAHPGKPAPRAPALSDGLIGRTASEPQVRQLAPKGALLIGSRREKRSRALFPPRLVSGKVATFSISLVRMR